MQWHEGEISEAVNKVDQADKFLVVFLRDEGVSSSQYNEIFENSKEIHSTLRNCVCLNLLKGGTEFHQFSEVYKATEVPSVYIITYLGQVVDIIKDDTNEDILTHRLKSLVSNKSSVNQSSLNNLNGASNSVGSGEIHNESVDDKLIEIRQKLAEKNRQRKEEEKAKEIEDELNRRELGKKLVELKKSQKEQEENEIKEEIRRKKMDDKEARDKVLRQIEEDKKERKKRFNDQPVNSPTTVISENIGNEVRKRESDNYKSTRLQFRFPDGSSKNNTFDCDEKFAAVRQFVTNHVRENMNSRKFEIKQFFPKKTLIQSDDLLSLKELQLVPSASLAVIFFDQAATSSQVTSFSSLIFSPINMIIETILTIFQWITKKVSSSNTGHRDNKEKTEGNITNWEDRQRRLIAAESRTIKKDGNIAQLSDPSKKKEDEDDDATWNGNSTQQM